MESKSEMEKMFAGELYSPADPVLHALHLKAEKLFEKYNKIPAKKAKKRDEAIKKLLGKTGEKIKVETPFFCDYGSNIEVGENFYANYGCIILDVNKVKIGKNCMLAPNVGIYSATHPVKAEERYLGKELGLPVTIGDNCWIGGGAVICPGVTIGDNVVVGAGSVVSKDVPSNVVVVGNPARIIRRFDKSEGEK
ncbi:MAG: sugar O-acetyltransferase [Clostridia bacterium]|nr:sugar O-acetyltransferase [Clostridia bacterium]